MPVLNLEMNFPNWPFSFSGTIEYPKDWIGLALMAIFALTILLLAAIFAIFKYKSSTHILNGREELDVNDNGLPLSGNFPMDAGANERDIPNTLRSSPVNQTPIRPRRPLR